MNAPDNKREIANLLWTVTDELALMSFEMTEFGEILTADAMDQRTQCQKMQSFELLSEKAVLYARLLSLMAKAMDNNSLNLLDEIKMAIAETSFPLIRERLTLALEPESSVAGEVPSRFRHARDITA